MINVGIMEFEPCGSGSLIKVFGRKFPVKLAPKMTYKEVLEMSTKKWENYGRSLDRYRGYILVYPDGKIARTIPGTDIEFFQKKCKEGLGKAYSRITLYLAPVLEASEAKEKEILLENEDEFSNLTNDEARIVENNSFTDEYDEGDRSTTIKTDDDMRDGNNDKVQLSSPVLDVDEQTLLYQVEDFM